jgi:aldehyde:ferredoxin oxidoreductase
MTTPEIVSKILMVDLTSQATSTEVVSRDLQRNFIGGFGVDVFLAWDQIKPGTDPFDPQNPIILSAGVLSGTHSPGTARVAAITKSPLTGAVSMGNGGMRFAPRLRAAGFDHVVITGKAQRPTVLKIVDGGVEFVDAGGLWGKDIFDTTDLLWEEFGDDYSVIAMGPSGEKLVRISLCLVDKISSLGKGSLSPVMGAKNLKAVMAGGNQSIYVSDPTRFAKAVSAVVQKINATPNRDKFVDWGVYWKWDTWWEEGFPYKANTEIFPKELATQLYGREVYLGKVKKGRAACFGCPLPDKEIMQVLEGEFAGLTTLGGGFAGRAANYGIRCGVGTYDKVIKTHDTANRLGICSHAFSALYDFVVTMFETGRLTEKDTGGIRLKRDFATTQKLMEMTAAREGFGDILADGYNAVFSHFGEDMRDLAQQAKGLDMLYEPRLNRLGTKTFAQVVNPRGGHHQPGVTPSDSLGKTVEDFQKYCQRSGVPTEAVQRIFSGPMKVNMARLTKHSQEFYSVLTSLGVCSKAPIGVIYGLADCAELYSGLTGIEMSAAEMKKAGERIWNLYKMLNVREGFNRADDQFPKSWLTPMKGHAGERPLMDYFETRRLSEKDLAQLLEDYYDECGWGSAFGVPTREKLEELGLTQALPVLEKSHG